MPPSRGRSSSRTCSVLQREGSSGAGEEALRLKWRRLTRLFEALDREGTRAISKASLLLYARCPPLPRLPARSDFTMLSMCAALSSHGGAQAGGRGAPVRQAHPPCPAPFQHAVRRAGAAGTLGWGLLTGRAGAVLLVDMAIDLAAKQL
eukprot:1196127-Rhodomonas_salina.3